MCTINSVIARPQPKVHTNHKIYDNDIAEIIKRVGQILQTDIWQALAYELYKQEIKLKTFI